MTGLDWLPPASWPLVLLVPLLAWMAVRGERRRRERQQAAFGRRTAAVLGRPAFVRARAVCGWLGALCCAIALLQPLAGAPPGAPARPEVVLCLDLSRSMLARDLRPDRLRAAQADIRALADAALPARVGLVAFAGTAEWIAPRTDDLQSLAVLAAGLDPSRLARGGTDLAAAIDTALSAFARGGGGEHAGIVLLTDGEDFADGALAAVQRAVAAGVSVSTLAYGSDGGSKIVVEGDDGEVFLQDGSGADVISVPDRAALAALAAAGGGTFANGDGQGALLRVFTDLLLPRAQRAAHRDPTRQPPHVFQWPLLLGVLLSMLALALPERRR
ncbi:MAG: VWA domain-containing protein [Planctomycetes bacterium]|nr:VWA domain-containing protein [Planctomycetota bacterium]